VLICENRTALLSDKYKKKLNLINETYVFKLINI